MKLSCVVVLFLEAAPVDSSNDGSIDQTREDMSTSTNSPSIDHDGSTPTREDMSTSVDIVSGCIGALEDDASTEI